MVKSALMKSNTVRILGQHIDVGAVEIKYSGISVSNNYITIPLFDQKKPCIGKLLVDENFAYSFINVKPIEIESLSFYGFYVTYRI